MKLTIRSRLTLVYAAVFGALLFVISGVSYRVLAYQLDADLKDNLAQRTSGLHGYLQFRNGPPSIVFDPSDAAEVSRGSGTDPGKTKT